MSMAPPCLAAVVEQATIRLPAVEPERGAAPEDDAQRLAWIAAGRAQRLLSHRCRRTAVADAHRVRHPIPPSAADA
ncbi:hypothetical protein [Xanthomonas theicola]|uniref:Uncharacterized protein n=1 Tax=Xanthomonas theicola TaxID=56464 RepID=A0A2S6ZD65_9XANT|nr:hypothetical protein [Xanthomonas theicola]PPT88490.1 hypothetical protein XthCFBP4691_14115 [Xanthomonas theicola]QNH25044.1 hypothetical protein G4Q83_10275 [Xanthomonas theicola]